SCSLHHSSFIVHFFLLLPRSPPRPTLFPYTTLFRSTGTSPPSRYGPDAMMRGPTSRPARMSRRHVVSVSQSPAMSRTPVTPFARSEEHTSELQSLRHLVCRLLLEKKKTNKSRTLHCI